MSDLTEIVVRVAANHPTWRRCRAWFIFVKVPSRIEVTAEELKAIQEDKFLLIVTAGGALEQAVAQNKAPKQAVIQWKEEGEEETPMTKKEIIAKLEEMKVEYDKRANRDTLLATLNEAIAKVETSSDGADENLNIYTVEEIVAKLEAKWLVEWTDFSKEAEKEALIALLLS